MKKIILATSNRDKLKEIKDIWGCGLGIEIDWMGNYPDIGEAEENGKTLHENAAIKARYIAEALECPAVADDTGFFVKALDGAPGVYSSRYAGLDATYNDNVDKILSELDGVPGEERQAEFRCVVCLSDSGHDDIFVEGAVSGYVTAAKRGEQGFGYDPVFEVDKSGRTFAEMSLNEKNSISHRYLAFKKMGEIISNKLKNLE